MKVFKYLILCLLLILNTVHAGRGRDGGWPESIKTLAYVKELLLSQVSQLSEEDIRFAINNMSDRKEVLEPSELDKALLLEILNSLEIADVVELEASKYTGARLFHYENNYPESVKLFATKNFYSNPKYQTRPSELSLPLIREIQKRILHEASHIWGFGEDTPEKNYANIFATRMIMLIYGSIKGELSRLEEMELLSKAFYYSFGFTPNANRENQNYFVNKDFQCVSIDRNKKEYSQVQFLSDGPVLINGDSVYFPEEAAYTNGSGLKTSYLRYSFDGFVMIETNSRFNSFPGKRINSAFVDKNANTKGSSNVESYLLCHESIERLKNYKKELLEPYYSKTQLVTELSYLSNNSFIFEISKRFQDLFSARHLVIEGKKLIQERQIYNIDQVIKIENEETYKKVISFRGRYTRKRHNTEINKLDQLMHLNIPRVTGKALLQSIYNNLQQDTRTLKSYSRQLFLAQILKKFHDASESIIIEYNNIIKGGKSPASMCSSKKRIGEFYDCQLDANISIAKNRILSLEQMKIKFKALEKEILEEIENFQEA